MSTTVCTHCKGTGFCNSSSDGCRMSFMEKHQNECLHNDPLIPCQFCQGNGVIDKEEPQAITSDGDREEMSDADWEGVSLASYFLNYWQSKLFSLLVFICAIFIPAFPNGYWILDSTLTPSQRIVIIISFAVLLAFINWSENLWHAIIPLKKSDSPHGYLSKLLVLLWLVIGSLCKFGYFLLLSSIGNEVFIVFMIVTSLPALVFVSSVTDEMFFETKKAVYVNLIFIGIGFIMIFLFNKVYLAKHPEYRDIASMLLVVKPFVVFAFSLTSLITRRMLVTTRLYRWGRLF